MKREKIIKEKYRFSFIILYIARLANTNGERDDDERRMSSTH